MKRYLLTAVLALLVGSPAMASTVQTNVRIETANETIYSGDVYLSGGCSVKDTEGKKHTFKKPVAACALKSAAAIGGFTYELQNSSYGLYLTSIDAQTGSGSDYWSFFVNYAMASEGVATYAVQNGDEIVLSLGGYPNSALELKLPSKEVKVGEPYTVHVKVDGGAIAGAEVHIGKQFKLTNSEGKATFKFKKTGDLDAYVEASMYTRSSTSTVRVMQANKSNVEVSEASRMAMIELANAFLAEPIEGTDDNTGIYEWMAQALKLSSTENPTATGLLMGYDPTVDEVNAAANLARHILTIEALGGNAASYNGVDYVARLRETKHGNQFGYKAYVNDDIFAGLALLAAGVSADDVDVQVALAATAKAINSDGGVSYAVEGDTSDVDTTAYYVQFLVAAGAQADAKTAVSYLADQQNLDGGWGYSNHDRSNSSSTSAAMQAFTAMGRDVTMVMRNHRNGVNFLAKMQLADGSFKYDAKGSYSLVQLNTAYAVMALLEQALPIQ